MAASKTSMQKRRAAPHKKNSIGVTPPNKPDQSTPEAPQVSAAPTPHRVADQSGGTPRVQVDQRKFSTAGNTQPPMAFTAHSMPAQSQAYMTTMSPIRPNNMAPYQQQPQMPFFANTGPLGMGDQDAGLPLQKFGMAPGGSIAPPQENSNGWQGMPNGAQPNSRQISAAVPKNDNAGMHQQRHPSQHQNPMTVPTMNFFNSAPDSLWFVGYDMEPPEMNQDMNMAGNSMDGYAMFAGGNNGNSGSGNGSQRHRPCRGRV